MSRWVPTKKEKYGVGRWKKVAAPSLARSSHTVQVWEGAWLGGGRLSCCSCSCFYRVQTGGTQVRRVLGICLLLCMKGWTRNVCLLWGRGLCVDREWWRGAPSYSAVSCVLGPPLRTAELLPADGITRDDSFSIVCVYCSVFYRREAARFVYLSPRLWTIWNQASWPENTRSF